MLMREVGEWLRGWAVRLQRNDKIHPNNPVLRNPEFAKLVFDQARQPIVWLFVSRRLRQSAKAIWKEEEPIVQRNADWLKTGDPSEVDDPLKAPNLDAIYMLIAYAIENLLKGLMLAKGIAKFRGQKYPNKLVSHDLRKLHERAKPRAIVSLHLLDALTYMSEWRARYPLPLKLQDFWPMDDKGNPKGMSLPMSLDEFWAYCDALDEELKGYLSENDRAGIDDLAKP
jgi:hypothetical protein